jgi:hypothetical protein
VLFSSQSYAQRFGIKFAWSNADYSSFNLKQDKSQLYQGYQIGIYARSDSRIYLQPEVYYHKKEGTFINEPGVAGYNFYFDPYNQSITLHTINIPLILGLNIIKHKDFTLHGFLGVQSSVVVGKSISTKYNFTPISKNEIENITVKYLYGAGIDIFFLSFDVRYYIDPTNLINSSGEIAFPMLKNYYTFNIGLKLLK